MGLGRDIAHRNRYSRLYKPHSTQSKQGEFWDWCGRRSDGVLCLECMNVTRQGSRLVKCTGFIWFRRFREEMLKGHCKMMRRRTPTRERGFASLETVLWLNSTKITGS